MSFTSKRLLLFQGRVPQLWGMNPIFHTIRASMSPVRTTTPLPSVVRPSRSPFPLSLRSFSSSLSSSSSSEGEDKFASSGAFAGLKATTIDELRGFPCLLVPAYYDFNKETGRIKHTTSCDYFDDNIWDDDSFEELWYGEDDDPWLYNLLNFPQKKLLKTQKNLRTMWRGQYLSPEESKCVGSSKGWLAFLNRYHGSFYLFNPLIPVDSFCYPFIPLPPIETLPTILSKVSKKRPPFSFRKRKPYRCPFRTLEMEEEFSSSIEASFTCTKQIREVSCEDLSKSFIKKVVLSAPPAPFPSNYFHDHKSGGDDDDQPCTVMIIHGYGKESQLAFCRLGDQTWTALNGPRTSYRDVMYSSKDQKFYALSQSDHVEAWDLSCPSSPKMTLIKSEMPALCNQVEDSQSNLVMLKKVQLGCRKYLVDSSGELLLVARYFNTFDSMVPEKYSYRYTQFFNVFKLGSEYNEFRNDYDHNKWIRIDSLGGRSLFVGRNESISVCAADYPGLKEDCFYFTCLDAETEPNTAGAYELGIYSMKHGEIDILYQDKYKKIDPHPIWIFPQL